MRTSSWPIVHTWKLPPATGLKPQMGESGPSSYFPFQPHNTYPVNNQTVIFRILQSWNCAAFMFLEIQESLAWNICETPIEILKSHHVKIKRYKIWLTEQYWCLPETLLIHHIFLWVFFIKSRTSIFFFFFLPCTLYVALGALILFSAEQKEMSGIILINVSYLILSVNKCFVCLITCTCEADFFFLLWPQKA